MTTGNEGLKQYDAMLGQYTKVQPKEGFVVYGVDDFEPPGEQLYPIECDNATGVPTVFPTREAAKAALDAYKKAHPSCVGYVYGSTEV